MKPSLVWILGTTVMAGTLAGVTLSHPSLAAGNPYKKITGNTGNCIFSNQVLAFDKEAMYQGVGTAFSAPDKLHARCYFPAQFQSYVDKGRVYNELRDGFHWIDFSVNSTKSGLHESYKLKFTYDNKVADWDQLRKDFDPQGENCTKYQGGCIDVEKAVRSLADQDGGNRPYTAKVCLNIYFNYGDALQEAWDENQKAFVQQPVLKSWSISNGCTMYTVK